MTREQKLRLFRNSVFVAAALLLLNAWFGIDGRFYDGICDIWAVYHSGRTVPSDIAIVELTDDTVRDRGVRDPFPRDILAAVIAEAAKAKPRAVVLDVFLVEPTEGDEALAEAIRDAGCVYLAQPVALDERGQIGVLPILPRFRDVARGHGVAAFGPERDRVIRHALKTLEIRERIDGQPMWNTYEMLPAAVAADVLEGNRALPSRILIDYHAYPTNLFKVIPAGEGLLAYHEASLVKSYFQLEVPGVPTIDEGDIVVVGSFLTGSSDFYQVPLTTAPLDGTMQGTELLAYALHSFLKATPPGEFPIWIVAIVGGVFFALAWWSAAQRTRARWVALSGAVLLGYLVLSCAMLSRAYFLPIAIPVLGWVLGAQSGYSYRHAARAEQERRERELREVEEKTRLETIDVLLHNWKNLIPMGWAETVESTLPPDVARDPLIREGLQTIRQSDRKLLEKVQWFRRCVRSGVFTEPQERFDFAAMVREVVSTQKARGTEGHTFVIEVPNQPIELMGFRRRIEDVVTNIVNNAVKYSPDGGQVKVEVIDHGGQVELLVSDGGIGMSEEQLESLFEKGVRHVDASSKIEGTGMGLYDAANVIEMHGGKMWAESAGLGKGSTFHVTLRKPELAGEES